VDVAVGIRRDGSLTKGRDDLRIGSSPRAGAIGDLPDVMIGRDVDVAVWAEGYTFGRPFAPWIQRSARS
jgi:hypothetical protein